MGYPAITTRMTRLEQAGNALCDAVVHLISDSDDTQGLIELKRVLAEYDDIHRKRQRCISRADAALTFSRDLRHALRRAIRV